MFSFFNGLLNRNEEKPNIRARSIALPSDVEFNLMRMISNADDMILDDVKEILSYPQNVKYLIEHKVSFKPIDDKFKKNQTSLIYFFTYQQEYSSILSLFNAKANIDWEYNLLFAVSDRQHSLALSLINGDHNPSGCEILIMISKKYIEETIFAHSYWQMAKTASRYLNSRHIKTKISKQLEEIEKAQLKKTKEIIINTDVIPVRDLVSIVTDYLEVPTSSNKPKGK